MSGALARAAHRVVIVGGVAGGGSCAARLRRLNENASITLLERGPYVSFANCGLPYRIGDVIQTNDDMLLVTPEEFRNDFNVDIHINTTVASIDRAARQVHVHGTQGGPGKEARAIPYDTLVLATGSNPVRPPLPGLDLEGVFTVKTIPDADRVRAWIEARKAKRAVLVGGGFIGLEMAENLHGLGIDVTILDKAPQVLPPLDGDMAAIVEQHLHKHGVKTVLGAGIAGVEKTDQDSLSVKTDTGASLDADMVILAIGVSPASALAKDAGIKLGQRGAVKVNGRMQTSDPHVYAVGDVTESTLAASGAPIYLPMAGPANRQGRVAAENIAGAISGSGSTSLFRGVQGTAICSVFGLDVGITGWSERALGRSEPDRAYRYVYLHPGHHVTYYPGSHRIHMKLIYDQAGQILGACCVGNAGVDKRVDVIATFIQMGGRVEDLAEAELAYSPQFGGAKDPVNLAGMVASNELHGRVFMATWAEYTQAASDSATTGAKKPILLDVRNPNEFAEGHVPGAVNVPLSELRAKSLSWDRDQPVYTYCIVGQRSYNAARSLMQNGFETVRSITGGIISYGFTKAADGTWNEAVQ